MIATIEQATTSRRWGMNTVDTDGKTDEEIFAMRDYGASLSPGIAGVGYATQTRHAIFLKKAFGVEAEHDESTLNLFWWGHALEPVIAKRFALDTGLEFAAHQILVRHPKYEWMTALIDGVTATEEIVDFKAMTFYSSNDLVDGDNSTLPAKAFIQANHQMSCCEKDHAHWACFAGGELKLKKFVIPRDEEMVELIVKLVSEFKQCVDTLTPPAEFEPADLDLFRRRYPDVDDGIALDLSYDAKLDSTAARLIESKAAQKYAEAEEKKCKAELLAAMASSANADLLSHTLQRKNRSRSGSRYVELICKSK